MINDFFNLSFKEIKRNKKIHSLILILTLLFIVLFVDCIFIKNFNAFYDSVVENNIQFRTFNFNDFSEEKKDYEKVSKIDHIVEIIDNRFYTTAFDTDIKINGVNGRLGLSYGTKNIVPKTIVGKNIEDLNPGEIICPYKFIPDSDSSSIFSSLDENKIIDSSKSLNLEFNALIKRRETILENNQPVEQEINETKKLKIVGLYDNTLMLNDYNSCYALPKDMEDIHNLQASTSFPEVIGSYNVVVDKESNVEKVRKEITSLGIEVGETNGSIDKKVLKPIILVAKLLFAIIFITACIILFNYINKRIKDEKKYFGILRAGGYNKKEIITKEITTSNFLVAISFIFSFIIYNILFIILNNTLFKMFSYMGFAIKNSIVITLILFILIVFIACILTSLLLIHNLKNTVMDTIKEE